MQNILVYNAGPWLKQLFEFLTMRDKIHLASTCHSLRQLCLDQQVWQHFQIHLFESDDSILTWVSKYIFIVRPPRLTLFVRNQHSQSQIIALFAARMNFVQEVDLYCESQGVHFAISFSCPHLTHLTLRSSLVSDALIALMSTSFLNLKSFAVITDASYFSCANIQTVFSRFSLTALVLKPHQLQFEALSNFLVTQHQLTELQLDVERCPPQILSKILVSTKAVEVLRLYHMENIKDKQIFNSFISPLRQLGLTKVDQLPLDDLLSIICTKRLTGIDFTQATQLTEIGVRAITLGSPFLQKLNLSWCIGVNNISLSSLIDSCLRLEELILTGVKCLTDSAFKEYFQLLPQFSQNQYDQGKAQKNTILISKIASSLNMTHIKTLRNLKKLQCCSCNNVSDSILKLIAMLRPQATVLNYYNQSMGFQSSF